MSHPGPLFMSVSIYIWIYISQTFTYKYTLHSNPTQLVLSACCREIKKPNTSNWLSSLINLQHLLVIMHGVCILLHSTHYPDSKSLHCVLREANTNFILVSPDLGLYPWSTTLKASMLTITPPLWFKHLSIYYETNSHATCTNI